MEHQPIQTVEGITLRAFARTLLEVFKMGRGILLWLLGIPLPIVILLVLFLR
ncbi:MAG TPA: hypothetical protein VGN93_12580 [Shinella sp.]|jgi:hypothetical protein|uniref:hypothetical protein n=1 Tax=Shinella sp. TaxID=1870904 RepID=UPI0029B63DE8|nr:hypothetical protein [Shinella sp.]MDX3974800.1 hypothetical protein [Shinella sp.]HEV7247810.1 hypothetical protein [Shinella sp.]